jgi:hypothetical protein
MVGTDGIENEDHGPLKTIGLNDTEFFVRRTVARENERKQQEAD